MKVSYANMKLKINTEVNTFDFCGQTIEVLKYLPAQDKYDLLMVTLQKAFQDGIYNEFKLDVYFSLNLVYMYTNISFTEKQREDEFKIYDNLKSNGFFDLFFKTMEQNEYDELFTLLADIRKSLDRKNDRTGSMVKDLLESLPENAEAAADIIKNFNPEDFKEVFNFANAINGDRNIFTNLPVSDR